MQHCNAGTVSRHLDVGATARLRDPKQLQALVRADVSMPGTVLGRHVLAVTRLVKDRTLRLYWGLPVYGEVRLYDSQGSAMCSRNMPQDLVCTECGRCEQAWDMFPATTPFSCAAEVRQGCIGASPPRQ